MQPRSNSFNPEDPTGPTTLWLPESRPPRQRERDAPLTMDWPEDESPTTMWTDPPLIIGSPDTDETTPARRLSQGTRPVARPQPGRGDVATTTMRGAGGPSVQSPQHASARAHAMERASNAGPQTAREQPATRGTRRVTKDYDFAAMRSALQAMPQHTTSAGTAAQHPQRSAPLPAARPGPATHNHNTHAPRPAGWPFAHATAPQPTAAARPAQRTPATAHLVRGTKQPQRSAAFPQPTAAGRSATRALASAPQSMGATFNAPQQRAARPASQPPQPTAARLETPHQPVPRQATARSVPAKAQSQHHGATARPLPPSIRPSAAGQRGPLHASFSAPAQPASPAQPQRAFASSVRAPLNAMSQRATAQANSNALHAHHAASVRPERAAMPASAPNLPRAAVPPANAPRARKSPPPPPLERPRRTSGIRRIALPKGAAAVREPAPRTPARREPTKTPAPRAPAISSFTVWTMLFAAAGLLLCVLIGRLLIRPAPEPRLEQIAPTQQSAPARP